MIRRRVQLYQWLDPPGKPDRNRADLTTPAVGGRSFCLESNLVGSVSDLLPKTLRNLNQSRYITFSSEIF